MKQFLKIILFIAVFGLGMVTIWLLDKEYHYTVKIDEYSNHAEVTGTISRSVDKAILTKSTTCKLSEVDSTVKSMRKESRLVIKIQKTKSRYSNQTRKLKKFKSEDKGNQL